MTKPTPPSLTTSQLYKQLEAEALKDSICGEKGVKMKESAERLAKEIGKKQLVFRVLFTMVLEDKTLDFVPKRSHFKNVCEKNWEVAKDENGLIWVDLSKPIAQKKK